MSNFPFITNLILRNNLDNTFSHILDLLTLLESDSYKDKQILASSLRKTIVIHTASIIEALLLWILKQKIGRNEIKLNDEWKYFDIKIIYKLNPSKEIIAGKRKKETKKLDRLDFMRTIDLCRKYKIINDKLAKNVHKVRELRNRQHIWGLITMEKEYKKSDLNFVFDVAKAVKEVVSNIE